jgi:hypothetical protein
MSARQQAGELRAILIRNFKKSRIREAMANTLKERGQVASGNLTRAILDKNESKNTSIRYKIDREFDSIYDVNITYTIDLESAPYASAVDTVLGRESSGMAPSIQAIDNWIVQKLSNGTWKGGNMYIIKRGEKSYSYPLTDFRYRRKLAFVIARSIKDRGYLKNRSPYITEGKLRYELAILDSVNEFQDIWNEAIAEKVYDKLTIIF